MSEKDVCPMKVGVNRTGDECRGAACAWWVEGPFRNRCAIYFLGVQACGGFRLASKEELEEYNKTT